MRKFSILAAIFLFCCLTACSQKQESSGAMSEETLEIPVETTTVTTSSFTRTRAYVGNISAAKQVTVIPLASERILEYPWENGDFVQQGGDPVHGFIVHSHDSRLCRTVPGVREPGVR